MSQKLIRNTDTGIVWSVSPAILGWVTGTQTQHMTSAGYTVTSVTDAVCRTVLKHNGWNPDDLPPTQGTVWTRFYPASDIPVTVQGASEDFITQQLTKVLVRDDQNANALNLQILNAKNEIIAAVNA